MRPLILFLFLAGSAAAQRYEYVYRTPGDSSLNCYLAVLPESGPVRGMIIRDFSSLPDTSRPSPYRLHLLAAGEGLITLYTVTSHAFPELYVHDSCAALLDEIVEEAILKYTVPEKNLFAGGLSAGGTRALRYAQFCAMGKSTYGHRINGVFAVDSPLDQERFWLSATAHKSNFKGGMAWEADLIQEEFPRMFGGTAEEAPESYRNGSVFSHMLSDGGNARWLNGINVLLIHEPDIDWWANERGASYFDINSYDLAALYLFLKPYGRARMITTTSRGFDKQGNRNCHSWSIVDEELLIDWLVSHLQE